MSIHAGYIIINEKKKKKKNEHLSDPIHYTNGEKMMILM